MNRSDLPIWASVAEIVSAIAIVISLLYVGFELNRNTAVLNVDGNREVLEATRTWERLLIGDKELVALYSKGPEGFQEFSKEERLRYSYLVSQYAAIWEQAFDEHAAGLLQTESWEEWNNAFRPELYYIAPAWPEIAMYFTDDFQRHIEMELAKRDSAASGGQHEGTDH